ncbi:hypothetical protein AOR13_2850 [Alteromonas stellipolaris LMG 21856]|nr:hypothetical protein AOR13_2850 [Alteromonas stellipolaris LMG 21856]
MPGFSNHLSLHQTKAFAISFGAFKRSILLSCISNAPQ